MLQRAKRLRSIFSPFLAELDRFDLLLMMKNGAKLISYLLLLTEPLFDFTLELSKTKDVTTY